MFPRHNARVYGVEDRIQFIVGDFFQVKVIMIIIFFYKREKNE